MHIPISLKLLFSLLLGAVIGLERESYERRTDKTARSGIGSLGIRSYALITSLGTLTAFISKEHAGLFFIVSCTFSLLLIMYYILGSLFHKDNGMTSELAILWSYFLGAIIGLEILPLQLIIAMAVVLILILSLKQKIKVFVASIKEYELTGFISYAIVALVILPFLPNTSYTLNQIPFVSSILSAYHIPLGTFGTIELFNPFSVWKVVAIVTGVEIAGYILEKTIGQQKGWLLTSIAGGFISSTSTTQSLAQQSKKSTNIDRLTAAALFANLSSFFQHFILLASINTLFLVQNTPYIIAVSITALILGIFFLNRKTRKKEELIQTKKTLKQDSIFSLGPALQFALIFLLVKIGTKVALGIFGDTGFIFGNIIGALAGLDAVTINISEAAGKTISFQTGVLTIILANAVNLISKTIYAFVQGKREFALKFGLSVLLIITASFAGYFLFI